MIRFPALIALGIALVAAPALLAQGSGSQQQPAPGAPAQQPAAPAAAEPEEGAPLSKLGLSDDQKKQIHTIRKQAQEQVQAVRKDTSLTSQQQTQQIRQIRRNEALSVDSVLTPEQREKYQAWRKAHQRRHRQQPPAKTDGA